MPHFDDDAKPVKLTLHISPLDDWIIEGIVRDRKITSRGFSKSEYIRELIRRDPAFQAALQRSRKDDR